MNEVLTLCPAAGVLVRKPDKTPLGEDGEAVEMTPYFARLLADGDLIVIAMTDTTAQPEPGNALKKRKPA